MATLTLTRDALDRSTRLAMRRVARSLLREVRHEAALLERRLSAPGDDAELVHDFRVALRRLRVWLKAFRAEAGRGVSRWSERFLQRLSKCAGEARDLEVDRSTLRALAKSRSAALAADIRRIERRTEPDIARARTELRRMLRREFPVRAARLAAELRARTGSGDPAMAVAMSRRLQEGLGRADSFVRRLQAAPGLDVAHEARIALRRLRYLLESFDGSSRLAATAVRRLSEIQAQLGRLHDMQMLRAHLTRHHAGAPLRARLGRDLDRALRRARGLTRSRRFSAAERATSRLIRQLERRRGDRTSGRTWT